MTEIKTSTVWAGYFATYIGGLAALVYLARTAPASWATVSLPFAFGIILVAIGAGRRSCGGRRAAVAAIRATLAAWRTGRRYSARPAAPGHDRGVDGCMSDALGPVPLSRISAKSTNRLDSHGVVLGVRRVFWPCPSSPRQTQVVADDLEPGGAPFDHY
jgi:hypothetical protein